jgi:hypothetical protein
LKPEAIHDAFYVQRSQEDEEFAKSHLVLQADEPFGVPMRQLPSDGATFRASTSSAYAIVRSPWESSAQFRNIRHASRP